VVEVAGSTALLMTSELQTKLDSSIDAPIVTSGRAACTWTPPTITAVRAGHAVPVTSTASGPPSSVTVSGVIEYRNGAWPQTANVVSSS
jgi:hypothetical protein